MLVEILEKMGDKLQAFLEKSKIDKPLDKGYKDLCAFLHRKNEVVIAILISVALLGFVCAFI